MKIFGTKASPGVEIAKALKLEPLNFNFEKKTTFVIDAELNSFNTAVDISRSEITNLKTFATEKLGEETAKIFDAHLLILEDPELTSTVIGKIQTGIQAEIALFEVRNQFVEIFKSMSDAYMKERASDIEDVTNRIIAHLTGQKIVELADLNEEVIIVANDLTPSETAQLNKKFVKGFVTNIGGRTSHSSIMARNMEIPAVVGTKVATTGIKDGEMLIIDGTNGIVIVNPSKNEIESFKKEKEDFEKKQEKLKIYVDKETITTDGHKVEIVSNIGSTDDLDGVIKFGSEGIGLFRTEFLYMGQSSFPTEDEQFENYKKIVQEMKEKPVVVRTLDIGGDKHLDYFHLPKELNPFLGQRAIRLSLANKYMFIVQLRALLRASVYGNLKIMFPMIATVQEFNQAKEVLLECKKNLIEEGYEVNENIDIGIMIEIPSAAMIADKFAKVVDFFSIGTNDLIQYTFAADRMNESVNYLYQPFNPSVLRLIKMVIDAAHKEGIWTGMCGEMAGDIRAIPLLLGLGLDEFSMSSVSVLEARELICSINKEKATELANEALEMSTQEEVLELLQKVY